MSFLGKLRQVAGPLARSTETALALVTPPGTVWVVPDSACPCSLRPEAPVGCLQGATAPETNGEPSGEGGLPRASPCPAGRSCQHAELHFAGKPAGTVLVCSSPRQAPAAAAILDVATATLRQIELEHVNNGLRHQLRNYYERLRATGGLFNHLTSGREYREILDHIVGKVSDLQDGLKVALWLIRDGRLEPVARRNAPELQTRNTTGGLLGNAIVHSRGFRVAASSLRLPDLEPELKGAVSIAAAPLRGSQGVLGVLVAWHERGPLDPRVVALLETFGTSAAVVVENDRLRQSLMAGERLRRDVEIAAQIQQTLLLGTPPVDLRRITASAETIPSRQIGGDFYDFFPYEQTLDVLVGDVMGKGVTAALVGAAAKLHFHRAVNGLLSSHPDRLPEPRDILAIVSAELFRQLARIETYVTLCYARFDLKRETVTFVDCGHPRAVHSHAHGPSYTLLQGKNMPVGFLEGEVYQQVTVPFDSGDVFFFYSDGLTEAQDRAGEYFGEKRLARLIDEHNHLYPWELMETVLRKIRQFTGSHDPADDLTCLAVKVGDMQATVAGNQSSLEVRSDPAELHRIQAFLRDLCTIQFQHIRVERDFTRLEAAVTETVRFIMTDAYHGWREGPIRLEAELFANRLRVCIFHRGEPFHTSPVDTRLVDKIRYSRSKHGENCVLLEKTFE